MHGSLLTSRSLSSYSSPIAGATAEVRFEIVPSQLAGWRFFDEARTTLHLAAGGVSPTRKTLPGLVTATLDVCR